MLNDKNGGQAFPGRIPEPGPWKHKGGEFHDGMTLLDWFAGQAMQGLLSGEFTPAFIPRGVASKSYEIAEAMVEEKKRREG